MHAFRSHEDRPGMFRGHLMFDAPENPICWLKGHTPRAQVIESQYIDPWVLGDCVVCGRRYNQRESVAKLGVSEDWKEISRRRVEVCRRDPKAFAAGFDRRAGWDKRDVTLSLEAHSPKSKTAFRAWGFHLHLGNTSSETPIDASVHAGPWSTYVTIGGIGGRFAELIGGGHKRDLRVEADLRGRRQLRWVLWAGDDGGMDGSAHRCEKWRPMPWERAARRRWRAAGKQIVARDRSTMGAHYRTWACARDGSIDLNPLYVLWGTPTYHYEPVGPVRSLVVDVGDFPGDHYLVDFQLELQSYHRDRGPAFARRLLEQRWTAKWECRPKGIPVRNHAWKGDEVLASSVGLPVEDFPVDHTEPAGWQPVAAAALVESIRRDRRHYEYRPPPVEQRSSS